MKRYIFSRVLIFSCNLPSSPFIPSLLLYHQSFKHATVHSHFSFCTCQLNALPQSPLSPPNPAKQTLTTHFPNREFHRQLRKSQALRALPSHCAGIPPSLQRPTAMDKRASKRKLTYCYGLEPFLVQLCFRHPGEKDTGGERETGGWEGETKRQTTPKRSADCSHRGGNWSNCKESRAPV